MEISQIEGGGEREKIDEAKKMIYRCCGPRHGDRYGWFIGFSDEKNPEKEVVGNIDLKKEMDKIRKEYEQSGKTEKNLLDFLKAGKLLIEEGITLEKVFDENSALLPKKEAIERIKKDIRCY